MWIQISGTVLANIGIMAQSITRRRRGEWSRSRVLIFDLFAVLAPLLLVLLLYLFLRLADHILGASNGSALFQWAWIASDLGPGL